MKNVFSYTLINIIYLFTDFFGFFRNIIYKVTIYYSKSIYFIWQLVAFKNIILKSVQFAFVFHCFVNVLWQLYLLFLIYFMVFSVPIFIVWLLFEEELSSKYLLMIEYIISSFKKVKKEYK